MGDLNHLEPKLRLEQDTKQFDKQIPVLHPLPIPCSCALVIEFQNYLYLIRSESLLKIMMKTILSLLLLFISVNDGLGFVSTSFTIRDEFYFSRPHTSSRTSLEVGDESTVENSALIPRKNRSVNISILSLAGFLTGITSYVTQGIASDDYEIAELPPPPNNKTFYAFATDIFQQFLVFYYWEVLDC